MLIKISDYTASLPGSVKKIAQISPLCLLLLVLGGFWFTLWNNKIRYGGGIIFALAAIIINQCSLRPDIIITPKYYAITNEEKLIFNQKKIPSFIKESWMNYYGYEDFTYHIQNSLNYKCDENFCEYLNYGKKVIFIKNANFKNEYSNADLIVNYSKQEFPLNDNIYISHDELLKEEIFFIDLKNQIKIISLNEYLGNRKWNK